MMKIRKITVILLTALLLVSMLSACQKGTPDSGSSSQEARETETSAESKTETKTETTAETAAETSADADTTAETSAAPETASESPEDSSGEKSDTASESAEEPAPVEKNGDVYILYTSDIHCGVDQGFGFAGLQQIRDNLEAQGYTTLLVDDGDAIQGETLGTLTDGKAITKLMNTLHYDVAIPGNHEFGYGMDHFMEIVEMADFPYISCNIMKEGELVFEPYVILEAAGMKIAFVGVTTPKSITSSTPAYFQNEAGEYIYSFLQDEDGTSLYAAVQDSVDAARAEGADYVYVMGHLGLEAAVIPWTYADVISHTTGIDVFLDGHSHDTEQVVMKNLDGEDVTRSACGTKLANIGYSHISAENGMCAGFEGERRVKNVMVGSEPLDLAKEYTLAGTDYTLLKNGDGQKAFDGAEVVISCVMIDNQLLIEYITEVLGGEIGGDYADPYGDGRITIIEK